MLNFAGITIAERCLKHKTTAEQINGREGETLAFIFSFLFHIYLNAGGFAPRYLSRWMSALKINVILFETK